MSETDRGQLERADMSTPSRAMQPRRSGSVVAYTLIALAVLGLGIWLSVVYIEGWVQVVALAAFVVFAIGAIAAVPLRRRP